MLRESQGLRSPRAARPGAARGGVGAAPRRRPGRAGAARPRLPSWQVRVLARLSPTVTQSLPSCDAPPGPRLPPAGRAGAGPPVTVTA